MASMLLTAPTDERTNSKNEINRELDAFLEALALLELGVLPKSA